MSPHLLSPLQAAEAVGKRLRTTWAEQVIAELVGEPVVIEIGLRPGVSGRAGIEAVGRAAWTDWDIAWRGIELGDLPGIELIFTRVSDGGVVVQRPARLRVSGVSAALAVIQRMGGEPWEQDVPRWRRVAGRLTAAGVPLTPGTLKAACAISGEELEVALSAVEWLRQHPDLSGYTERQLPTPQVHTKWWRTHRGLIRALTGRDPLAETRPRLSVVHLTYLDPVYLASGGRRHDAWTTGDRHQLAYEPEAVLVVENRDARLWFPEVKGAVVVEGGGKAAASLLQEIPWVRQAHHLCYWGDIDADGYAILNHLRGQLAPQPVTSILMDEAACRVYAHLGVERDQRGHPIPVSPARLPHLMPNEAAGYAVVNGGGAVRRIEQERIPATDARDALVQGISGNESQSGIC